MKKNWPLWEVFVRSKNGLEHRHFGSLHAPDADMALKNARDVYTRRNEGVSIWVVESKNIKASNPDRSEEHTSELQSLTEIAYAVFCLDRKSVV